MPTKGIPFQLAMQLATAHQLFTVQSRRLEPQAARKITQPDSLVDCPHPLLRLTAAPLMGVRLFA